MMPVTVGKLRKHKMARKPLKMAGLKGWLEPAHQANRVALDPHHSSLEPVRQAASLAMGSQGKPR